MDLFRLTFVLLCLGSFFVSAQGRAQGFRQNVLPSVSTEVSEPPEASSTRIHLDALSAQATTPTDNINFTSYTASLEQDLGTRITLTGSVPMIMGSDNGNSFNQWGNPFAGASLKLLQLQEFHPLWLTAHGGFRFPQSPSQSDVAAPYGEIHTGASLIKHFTSVEIIMDGDYVQKVNDPQPQLTVGNELDAYGGLKIDAGGGVSLQGGYVFRHADPTRLAENVLIGSDMYTAGDLRLYYKLMANTELVGKFQFPLESSASYVPNLAAFGDLSTQATVGESWSVGFNIGL